MTTFDQPVICPVLIGRTAPLEVLERWLVRAREGHGQTVLIAGEAGVGKSRLLAEARRCAERLGLTVLLENCFEADRTLPYASLLDLLHALAVSWPVGLPGSRSSQTPARPGPRCCPISRRCRPSPVRRNGVCSVP